MVMFLVIGIVLCASAAAQTGKFGWAQSTVASSGLTQAVGVAVDGSGNVYIAEYGQVVKETPSGGSYAKSTVASTAAPFYLDYPQQIAVGSSGNVYIADVYTSSVLKGTPSGASYTASTVASDAVVADPQGVAVDSNGNVYIADTLNNRVVEETLSGRLAQRLFWPTTTLPTTPPRSPSPRQLPR